MKLIELHGWDRLRKPIVHNADFIPYAYDILDVLKDSGLEKLGDGRRAVVFSRRGKPYVYKLFAEDHCFYNFVQFIKERPDNPHLPKLLSPVMDLVKMAKRVDDLDPNDMNRMHKRPYLVKMEKLTPMPRDEFFNNRGLQLLLNKVYGDGSLFKDNKKDLEIELFQWFKKENKLAHTIIDIKEKLVHDECFADMHFGNFMKRGETIVITDPVFPMDHMGY